jgi:hypothetical protein
MNFYEALARLVGPAIDQKIKKAAKENERRIEDMAVVK